MAEENGGKIKVIKAGRPRMLGDTSTWMWKHPLTILGIGMERGKGLGVKGQREVNQWKQCYDNRGALHWSSDWEER